ncbi:MAG TPA: hypothetical protein ENG59_02635 [Chloroflexi bacterium]|nr:MAG: hypothetical protein DRI46_01600 [Chloroflexota bacterium]HDD55124.1 hypothetical protein [Chloroflexota bacterium]
MDKFSPKKYPVLVTALALIATYTLAYLYEKFLYWLIRYERDRPDFLLYWRANIVSSIAPLLFILLIFTLAWLVLRYLPPSRFSATLYLLSGLITIGLSLSGYIAFLFGPNITFPGWLRSPNILGRFRNLLMLSGHYGCRGSIYYLACGCILIGMAGFWRSRKEKPTTSQEA